MKKAFEVQNPDLELSPFTGMSKKHYIELAKYLLERAFEHVGSIETPLTFPSVPGKTYPEPNAPDWRYKSADFEALERTFTLAGPLIHIDPETTIKGINLRDYYSLHIYNAFTPGHANSLPLPEELPDSNYQFTCEFGGLFKTLLLMPETIWFTYSEEQREEMVVTISKWAHHRTTQNNWRIFNIITLSFLKKYGYEIDDELLKSHLLWVASYHSGNGWYLEQTYNYYSISLFIVYTTIWNRTFGDEYYPEIAAIIEKSAQKLMESLTSFFGRDGYINMWSRSICYRTWVSGAFPVGLYAERQNLVGCRLGAQTLFRLVIAICYPRGILLQRYSKPWFLRTKGIHDTGLQLCRKSVPDVFCHLSAWLCPTTHRSGQLKKMKVTGRIWEKNQIK